MLFNTTISVAHRVDLGSNFTPKTVTPCNMRPRFNVSPTTTIDVVVLQDAKRYVVPMRWGLVPSWWSKPLKELKLATFNARAETVTTKPFFFVAHSNRRAVLFPFLATMNGQTCRAESVRSLPVH